MRYAFVLSVATLLSCTGLTLGENEPGADTYMDDGRPPSWWDDEPAEPDDPATPVRDDPTRNVVGNLPLLYAHKTVQIQEDLGSPGIVDPGDVLRYTIVISNFGAIPATGVTLTDTVPAIDYHCGSTANFYHKEMMR